MTHASQIAYCNMIKEKYPEHFTGKDVLDFGSLDINGNNRTFFTGGTYEGVDVYKGRNVDIVMPVHLYAELTDKTYDVVISTNALEHDKHWLRSLEAVCKLCKPGGLIVLSTVNNKFQEHGTTKCTPQNSPGTNDYYGAFSVEMMSRIYEFAEFTDSEVSELGYDVRFYGIKKT